MKKLLITTALAVSLSSTAFAFGSNNNNTTNNPTANGGNASAGAFAGAVAGSSSKSKSSASADNSFNGYNSVSNTGNNRNTVKSNVNTTDVNLVNAGGGDAYARTGDSDARLYDNSRTSQTSLQGQSNEGNNTDVSIEGDNFEAPEIPVNSAIAFAPVPTSDCLGSIGAAGQGSLFGGALSFTTQSRPCNIREYSKLATAYAGKKYGRLVLCQDSIIRESFKDTPMACPVEETTSLWTHGRIEGSANR